MARGELDELLEQIQSLDLLRTNQGTFVRVEDLEKLVAERQAKKAEETPRLQPRTFEQAKAAIRGDEEIMAAFQTHPPLAGEGVKTR